MASSTQDSDDSDDSDFSLDVASTLRQISSRSDLDIKLPKKTWPKSEASHPSSTESQYTHRVEEPKIPVQLQKHIDTKKRAAALRQIVAEDEKAALEAIQENSKIEQEVRRALSHTAAANEKYLHYVIKHYRDDVKSLEDFHMFTGAVGRTWPKRYSRTDRIESHMATDLESVIKHYPTFYTTSVLSKVSAIIYADDSKVIESIDCLTRTAVFSFPIAQPAVDAMSEAQLDEFFQNIGIDVPKVISSFSKDVSELRSLDPVEDKYSIGLSIMKFCAGTSVYYFSVVEKLYSALKNGELPIPQKRLEFKNYEAKFKFLMQFVLFAFIDAKVQHGPSSSYYISFTPVTRLVTFFDALIQSYVRLNSELTSVDDAFRHLCSWFGSFLLQFSRSLHILSRPVLAILSGNLSRVTRQLIEWVILRLLVAKLPQETEMFDHDTEESLLTFELEKGTSSNEILVAKVAEYLEFISSRSLKAEAVNFRDDVTYFQDLKARFDLLEKLVLSKISHFRGMKTLNKQLLKQKSHLITSNTFKVQLETMIPHILSVHIASLRSHHFVGFDFNSNPALGKLMLLLGRLRFRLEKELEVKVIDMI